MKTIEMKPICAASHVFGIAAFLSLPGCQHDTREAVALDIDEAFSMEAAAYSEPIKDIGPGFHWDELGEFVPAKPTRRYSARECRGFLPKSPVVVGDVWKLEAEPIIEFLRQFHPGATFGVHDNGDSKGAYASLRALSDRWADVVFRLHAMFVFPEGYLTPSQFTGRLVLDREQGQIAYFRLYVPTTSMTPINFDANRRVELWVKDEETGKERSRIVMASGSGCLPRLELVSGDARVLEGIQWSRARSEEEVNRDLAHRFYDFKKIEWAPFEEALSLSRRTGKPLHVVAVDGTLDDESC